MSEFAPEPQIVDAPIGDLGGDAPVVDAPVAPEYVSREDYEQLVGAVGYLVDQIQNRPGNEDPNTGLVLDPLANDANQFTEQLRAIIREETAGLSEYQQHLQASEGTQQLKDVVHDLQAQKGEFLLPDTADRALPLARELYPEFASRFGHNDRSAEMAIEKAYEDLKAWELQIGKAYYERETNQLATLAGAPRQPMVPGRTAQQQLTTVEGGNEMDVLAKYFPRG